MIIDEIRDELFSLQDTGYRDFQSKLTPTIDPSTCIGVRTPALRKMAKRLVRRDDVTIFLRDLPHRYFDENQLHAFIISEMKDYEACLDDLERFLPYVDNWATCDQMSPKVFKKHHGELIGPIRRWIASDQTYTLRFGVGMLMEHYLGDDFDPAYPEMVAGVRSEEYYVRMMAAWYFATALAKRWDDAIAYLEERRLDPWTHNKAIQKAVESRRISAEQKDYLRKHKMKGNAAASSATRYDIRHATESDIPVILDIYASARAFMRKTGNLTQWPDGYPGRDDILSDIAGGNLHVCVTGDEIVAVFFLAKGPDPTYAHIDGAWLNDEPYSVIHRIAAREGTGAGRYCIQHVCDSVRNLRIDTHEDNRPMRHVLTSLGFVECGTIICNDGTPRVAYQHAC